MHKTLFNIKKIYTNHIYCEYQCFCPYLCIRNILQNSKKISNAINFQDIKGPCFILEQEVHNNFKLYQFRTISQGNYLTVICIKAFIVFKLYSSNDWKFLMSQKTVPNDNLQKTIKKTHRKQVIDLTAEEAEIIPGTCREE